MCFGGLECTHFSSRPSGGSGIIRRFRNAVLHSALLVQDYSEDVPEGQFVSAVDVADTPILTRSKIWDRKKVDEDIDMDQMLLLVERAKRLSRDLWAIALPEYTPPL